jgi:hypothetical protein
MRKSELNDTPPVSDNFDHDDTKVAEKALKGKTVDCLTT